MFSVYDYVKEENILCFKPDPLRGKLKKTELVTREVNEE